ncbi:MAG TPA: type II toxin-antitoxin system ParD family antitoxin [Isosphaeraceae bacterium]|nr:type II toxin-antitoxin system ParD family antitoxin [Isosphaeraceae bacterium]
MPTRNVNLTNHFDHFVESLIAAGRYKNASEVMRAGLRLLEQETRENEEKLEILRRLASESFGSLDRGEGTDLEGRPELRDFIRGIGQRAALRNGD